MTDDVSRDALLRGVGAVGIGAGALAIYPSLAAAVPLANVLMFARMPGFRRDVPAGTAVVHQLGDRNSVVTTSTARTLAQYEAFVWLPAIGDELDTGAGAEDDWAWHGRLVGGYAAADRDEQQVTLIVEDAAEPRTHPCGAVQVLIRVGADRSITWWHDVGAGRARYADARRVESYSDTVFRRIRLPGLRVSIRPLWSETFSERDAGPPGRRPTAAGEGVAVTLPLEDRPCRT